MARPSANDLRKDGKHPAAITWGDLEPLSIEENKGERERFFRYIRRERTLSRDFHQPFKNDPPSANGSCATQMTPGKFVRSKGFPKKIEFRESDAMNFYIWALIV